MADRQPTLFPQFRGHDELGPTGVTFSPVVQRRLSKQCAAILDRLKEGPATNSELARLALSYTRRLSDLREAGYTVDCYQRDEQTGLNWYRLTGG